MKEAQWMCEYKCGYSSRFKDVEVHEDTCTVAQRIRIEKWKRLGPAPPTKRSVPDGDASFSAGFRAVSRK